MSPRLLGYSCQYVSKRTSSKGHERDLPARGGSTGCHQMYSMQSQDAGHVYACYPCHTNTAPLRRLSFTFIPHCLCGDSLGVWKRFPVILSWSGFTGILSPFYNRGIVVYLPPLINPPLYQDTLFWAVPRLALRALSRKTVDL